MLDNVIVVKSGFSLRRRRSPLRCGAAVPYAAGVVRIFRTLCLSLSGWHLPPMRARRMSTC